MDLSGLFDTSDLPVLLGGIPDDEKALREELFRRSREIFGDKLQKDPHWKSNGYIGESWSMILLLATAHILRLYWRKSTQPPDTPIWGVTVDNVPQRNGTIIYPCKELTPRAVEEWVQQHWEAITKVFTRTRDSVEEMDALIFQENTGQAIYYLADQLFPEIDLWKT